MSWELRLFVMLTLCCTSAADTGAWTIHWGAQENTWRHFWICKSKVSMLPCAACKDIFTMLLGWWVCFKFPFSGGSCFCQWSFKVGSMNLLLVLLFLSLTQSIVYIKGNMWFYSIFLDASLIKSSWLFSRALYNRVLMPFICPDVILWVLLTTALSIYSNIIILWYFINLGIPTLPRQHLNPPLVLSAWCKTIRKHCPQRQKLGLR